MNRPLQSKEGLSTLQEVLQEELGIDKIEEAENSKLEDSIKLNDPSNVTFKKMDYLRNISQHIKQNLG